MVRYDKSTAARGAKYVEDRRGAGGGRRRGRVGGGRAVGGGIGGLILVIIGVLFGIPALSGGGGLGLDTTTSFDAGQVEAPTGPDTVDPQADTVEYMQFLMFDIQETWDLYFDQAGLAYQPTTLVIYEDVVQSGCGQATSAVGPFYCPAPTDRKVYVDLGFWDELSIRFGAPGDFAQAYVIAHEVGHHIQSITGISDQVRAAQQQDPGNRNEYSIRQELQADCLAGVWAFSANQRLTRETGVPIIERGDITEGLQAAASVGDDRIQSQAGMTIDPHTWTHGSSQQRIRWFEIGFDTGDPEACDPFAVDDP
ncbi:MAG: neutral zinc metallopeptidase [Actinomycetota bacterium]